MKGLQFLLQSLGIVINPDEIQQAFEQGKDALPKLAHSFEVFNTRLARMEQAQIDMNSKLELLLSRTSGEVAPDPVHEGALANVSVDQLKAAFINGAPGLVARDA